MLATTKFDLRLDNNIFAILNDKFNADKTAINSFINNNLKNLFKTKKEEGLSFDDLNKETQDAIIYCENNAKNLKKYDSIAEMFNDIKKGK